MLHYRVNLPVQEAGRRIEETVLRKGISTDCVDRFYAASPQTGAAVLCLVFEKYYVRTSSRTSLAVTVTDLSGATEVHAVGSGGSEGAFFDFDWGTAADFEAEIDTALQDSVIG